jgi:hypothetical protein
MSLRFQQDAARFLAVIVLALMIAFTAGSLNAAPAHAAAKGSGPVTGARMPADVLFWFQSATTFRSCCT